MKDKYGIFLGFLFLLLFGGKAEAQFVEADSVRSGLSDPVYISGILIDKETRIRLSDVNVMNIRSQKAVRSNTHGIFFIEAHLGDSLSFTKVGYGPVKTRITSSEDIVIAMRAGLEIETVVVTGRSREAEMRDVLGDYGKKGVYNGGENKVGTYLNSPVTALYNLFGKDAKNAKRFQAYMEREQEELKVDRIFTKSKVQEETELTGGDLEDFMDLYRPSYAMVSSWGEYDLVAYISRSFKRWEEEGRPRPQRLPKIEIAPQEK